MPIVTLRDLYVAELQDLLDAEQQILTELPAMAARATSSVLRDSLLHHLDQTRIHAERLELLLRKLDAATEGDRCQAIRALIEQGRRRGEASERGDVLDAALIGIAQRIEHYEIAAYGCARTYARTLGDRDAENLLQQTLDEESAADARLTRIAEHDINEAASDDGEREREAQQRRLRYLPASHIRQFKYREFRVRNGDNEDLGSLDGLIVDTHTHTPEYFVIDSGGWFIGQRFVVPIDALRPDEATQTLRTYLERKAIESYPPFNPDAYLGPRDAADSPSADEYQPPTWLMTGVWMTDASGFASVPPRAQSDFQGSAEATSADRDTYPQRERMVAREESEDRGKPSEDKG